MAVMSGTLLTDGKKGEATSSAWAVSRNSSTTRCAGAKRSPITAMNSASKELRSNNIEGGATMRKDYDEMYRLLNEANEAKDRLARLADKLESKGYHRKARSCMALVYKIEEWQNRG